MEIIFLSLALGIVYIIKGFSEKIIAKHPEKSKTIRYISYALMVPFVVYAFIGLFYVAR